ncbi:MAG TPA: glycerol-3-phosphate 1-O-acyltransferase PlsY [Candidatus Brocadiia bacterium]|nr:glycerol-3-phosphate 1-O-acyltransferase PlsY [Candidatus Brocadiia bacterium]
MTPAWTWGALPAAYLIGSIPFGWIAVKLIRGVDLRQHGSGNIGATNAARVLGWKLFPVIFALDFGKGFGPTYVAASLSHDAGSAFDPSILAVLTGMCAMLGHVFSIFLRFKGGKAVATSCGVFACLIPFPVAIAFAVWIVFAAAWRYVSLASMAAAIALAISAILILDEPMGRQLPTMSFVMLAVAMVILLHRSNIRRLLKGSEPKIGAGRK